MSDLATLTRKALDDVAASTTLAALDDVRVRWLGKKGVLTEQLKSLGALPAADRPAAGARINEAKLQVQTALDAAQSSLEAMAIEAELAAVQAEKADTTNLGHVAAPFAGVVTLQTVEGAHVEVGQPVATIEAMKMEATITASVSGLVRRLAIGKTQAVDAGDLIVVVEADQP